MQLFYRTKGDVSLPPLVILHGLWGASDNWLQVAELLCTHFYVTLPDLPNHGRSPHCPSLDYESLSQELILFLQGLPHSQKPMIAGHSMGGKTAMTALLKRPQLVQKAAILDIAPINYPCETDSIHRKLLEFMSHFPCNDYVQREAIHAQIRQAFPSENVCQIVLKNLRKGAHGFEWKVNTQAIAENMEKLLSWDTPSPHSNDTPPLLFVRGEKSAYLTPATWESTTRIFPNAQLTTIRNAGHFLHTDQPHLLAETLLNFFNVPL